MSNYAWTELGGVDKLPRVETLKPDLFPHIWVEFFRNTDMHRVDGEADAAGEVRPAVRAAPQLVLCLRGSHFPNFWVEFGPVSQWRKARASELPADRDEGGAHSHAADSQGETVGPRSIGEMFRK